MGAGLLGAHARGPGGGSQGGSESRIGRTSYARVIYTNPTAMDAVDGAVPVSCTPLSGSLFNYGIYAIPCTATDDAGNVGHSAFKLIVRAPTTPGAVTNPGNTSTPLTSVHRGQVVRVSAGGFAPGNPVLLSFVTSTSAVLPLRKTRAGPDGRIDALVLVPILIPRGESVVQAVGPGADGSDLIRVWIVTVEGGPLAWHFPHWDWID